MEDLNVIIAEEWDTLLDFALIIRRPHKIKVVNVIQYNVLNK
jgi:hypothetical protein